MGYQAFVGFHPRRYNRANPCLVPQVFLAELGRQITLLAINDRPPDDDDYDW